MLLVSSDVGCSHFGFGAGPSDFQDGLVADVEIWAQ